MTHLGQALAPLVLYYFLIIKFVKPSIMIPTQFFLSGRAERD
jgi:hypothetical protein